jgi:hypothetical protein
MVNAFRKADRAGLRIGSESYSWDDGLDVNVQG